jgi:hypothetical protein
MIFQKSQTGVSLDEGSLLNHASQMSLCKVHNVMLQDTVSFYWVKGKVFPIHTMESYMECRGV